MDARLHVIKSESEKQTLGKEKKKKKESPTANSKKSSVATLSDPN